MLDIPKKSWLAITDHAKTCVVDDYKLYSYYSQELQIGLLFNSIYILVGVTFDWEIYYSPDILTPQEKVWIHNLFVNCFLNRSKRKTSGFFKIMIPVLSL